MKARQTCRPCGPWALPNTSDPSAGWPISSRRGKPQVDLWLSRLFEIRSVAPDICLASEAEEGQDDRIEVSRAACFLRWALALVLATAGAVPTTSAQTDEFPALRALPQRTQEIVALVAVQARIEADLESSASAFVSGADRSRGSALDSMFANSQPEGVLAELEIWVDAYGSQELKRIFNVLPSRRQEMRIWFRVLMDDFSKNFGTQGGYDSLKWVMNRIRLAQKHHVQAWELMLWGLISEITTDPVERMALWNDATAFADFTVQKP